jgi:hypothetical protein
MEECYPLSPRQSSKILNGFVYSCVCSRNGNKENYGMEPSCTKCNLRRLVSAPSFKKNSEAIRKDSRQGETPQPILYMIKRLSTGPFLGSCLRNKSGRDSFLLLWGRKKEKKHGCIQHTAPSPRELIKLLLCTHFVPHCAYSMLEKENKMQ